MGILPLNVCLKVQVLCVQATPVSKDPACSPNGTHAGSSFFFLEERLTHHSNKTFFLFPSLSKDADYEIRHVESLDLTGF